jgi:hypothetical protein
MNAKRRAASLLLGAVLVACGSTPGPTAAPTATASLAASPITVATSGPTVAPLATVAAATPTPQAAPTPAPSLLPSPSAASLPKPSPAPTLGLITAASLPVRGSARELGDQIEMTPGPGGGLYVSVPAPGGSVLALLDPDGRPSLGWPVQLVGWNGCALPPPAADGSVRVVCGSGGERGDRAYAAYAFDSEGNLLAGWPVALPVGAMHSDQRVIGDRLLVIGRDFLPGVDPETGTSVGEAWLVTVDVDGAVRSGIRVRAGWGGDWRLGPDGIAYGIEHPNAYTTRDPQLSQITAFELAGVRPGWPIRLDGVASAPGFGPGGRLYLTIGSFGRGVSRTVVLDRDGNTLPGGSKALPITTAESGSEFTTAPAPPVVAADGSLFVLSDLDRPDEAHLEPLTKVFALDTSGEVMRGWPLVRTGTWLMRPGYCRPEVELGCPFSPATPALGPGNVLYLLRPAPHGSSAEGWVDASIGGSVVAIGPDGRVRSGWPVVLRRSGAAFWSVVVGPDGTAYALAIEPEAGDRTSATILAIGPDGAVSRRTAVVAP